MSDQLAGVFEAALSMADNAAQAESESRPSQAIILYEAAISALDNGLTQAESSQDPHHRRSESRLAVQRAEAESRLRFWRRHVAKLRRAEAQQHASVDAQLGQQWRAREAQVEQDKHETAATRLCAEAAEAEACGELERAYECFTAAGQAFVRAARGSPSVRGKMVRRAEACIDAAERLRDTIHALPGSDEESEADREHKDVRQEEDKEVRAAEVRAANPMSRCPFASGKMTAGGLAQIGGDAIMQVALAGIGKAEAAEAGGDFAGAVDQYRQAAQQLMMAGRTVQDMKVRSHVMQKAERCIFKAEQLRVAAREQKQQEEVEEDEEVVEEEEEEEEQPQEPPREASAVLRMAVSTLRRAIEYDDNGQNDAAFRAFSDAADLLAVCSDASEEDATKDMLASKAEECRSRAEELHLILMSQHHTGLTVEESRKQSEALDADPAASMCPFSAGTAAWSNEAAKASDSKELSEGMQLLSQGVEADRAGRKADAVDLYERGVRLLELAAREEPDDTARDAIEQQATAYKGRLQMLKFSPS